MGIKTSEDWLELGLQTLLDQGHEGLTVERLSRRLGVTKGSFYWHFRNVDTFHQKLLNRWLHWDTITTAQESRGSTNPLERLQSLIEDKHLLQGDNAIKAWARTNRLAAQMVPRVEQLRHQRLAKLLQDQGLDRRIAALRAQLFVWVGSRSTGAPIEWRHQVMRELITLFLQK